MALTRKQFDVLEALATAPSPLTQRGLAEAASCSLGTVNKVMKELSEAGFTAAGSVTPAGLAALEPYLMGTGEIPEGSSHEQWLREIAEKTGRSLTREQAEEALHQAVADTCYQVLCDAGVYKQDEAGQAGLKRFLDTVF